MIRYAAYAALAPFCVALTACSATHVFHCATDDQCALSDRNGVCVDQVSGSKGVCALADSDCPSGFRYDDSAGSRGGDCYAEYDMGLQSDLAGGDLTGAVDSSLDSLSGMDLTSPTLTWTKESNPAAGKAGLYAVWGSSQFDIYAVGEEFDHSSTPGNWANVTPTGFSSTVFSLWGKASNDIYAVGQSGLVLHYGGTSWGPQNSSTSYALRAAWSDGTTIFAVGDTATIITSSGNGTWTARNGNITAEYSGVWGTVGGATYVVGTSLVGTNPNGVIIKSTNGGANWSQETTGVPAEVLDAVWGSGPTDIYVAGRTGVIIHSTGNGSWTGQPTIYTAELYAIWGSGPNDVYIVGGGGIALHSTGDGKWSPISQISSTEDFRAVWGTSSTNVYIISSAGTIWHGH